MEMKIDIQSSSYRYKNIIELFNYLTYLTI
jgi:hypothetical protein